MAGIYLHIPFCKQKCTYCNFHFSTSLRGKDELLQAMLRELEMQKDYLRGQAVETIYFGGGTPSLLGADEIMRLIDAIYTLYPVQDLKECTLEANPDDLTPAYLKALRHTPIDRFSIGVQSFKESDLLFMNRAHNTQQADYAIKAAQDAGFSKLTIDLIYGTPGLSDQEWTHNLRQVAELQIPHFSAYALTVEEGTLLYHDILKKKTRPLDNEQAASQFELLMEQSALMGYDHYEISNLALPGQYAIHNTNYWHGQAYLGIGPSAHSFDGGNRRRWNVANNALYTQNILTQHLIPYEEEILTPVQHLNEYIMTSLRTMWGCDLDKVSKEWGTDYAAAIERSAGFFIEDGKAEPLNGKLILTPKGKLLADGIAAALFIDQD
jgi:oxygen-independent coproporphyrinogen-3 oxidase